jgi:hypothetical protein
LTTLGTRQKRQLRRRERERRRKWLAMALFSILAVGALIVSVRLININTVLERKISEHIGPQATVSIGHAFFGLTRYGPGIRMHDFKVKRVTDDSSFEAKNASLSLSLAELLSGKFEPKALSASDISIVFTSSDEIIPQENNNPKQEILPSKDSTKALNSQSSLLQKAQDKAIASDDFHRSLKTPSLEGAYRVLKGLLNAEDTVRGVEHIHLQRMHVVRKEMKNTEGVRLTPLMQAGTISITRPKPNIPDKHSLLMSIQDHGESRPWTIFADIKNSESESIAMRATLENVPFLALSRWQDFRTPILTLDSHFSGTLVLDIDSHALKTFNISLSSEQGSLIFDNPDLPKVPVKGIHFSGSWDQEQRILKIPTLKGDVGANRFSFSGNARFLEPKKQDSLLWDFSLSAPKMKMKGVTVEDKPINLSEVSLTGAYLVDGRLKSALVVKGDQIDIAVSGEQARGKTSYVSLTLGAKKTNARHLLGFWPIFVAPNTHNYLVHNLKKGLVDLSGSVRFQGKDLEEIDKKGGILSDQALNLDVALQDGVLTPAPQIPDLSSMDLKGTVTGQKANLQVKSAQMLLKKEDEKQAPFVFHLSDGGILISDFYTVPQARIQFHLQSRLDGIIAFLKTPLINLNDSSFLNSAQIQSGDSDLNLVLTLPLTQTVARKDVSMSGQGRLTNVTLSGVYGKEAFSNANFSVDLKNKESLVLDGKGKIFDLNTDLRLGIGDVEKPGLVLSALLTDEIREKKGWRSQGIQGPLKVSIDVPMTVQKMPIISIDLLQARLSHFIPGWDKSPGESGLLTFSLRENALENISLVSKGLTAEGKGMLRGGGAFSIASLDLKSVQWSKGDQVSVIWQRNDQGSLTQVKGSLLKIKPLIPALASLNDEEGKGTFVLDVGIDRVIGIHGETLSNFKLYTRQEQGKINQFKMTGDFSGSVHGEKRRVMGEILPLTTGDNDILIRSNDGGALLKVLGVYKDMEGGTLEFRMDTNVRPAIAHLMIQDFLIQNASFQVSDSQKQAATSPDTSNSFSKLSAQFIFGSEVVVRNGLILGPSTGISIEGKINTQNGTLNLFGTYVPAYALNNTFANIPLIGPLLGGGPDEGLFAVTFQITGPIEGPRTIINPLSALTPGLLRKFFDIAR